MNELPVSLLSVICGSRNRKARDVRVGGPLDIGRLGTPVIVDMNTDLEAGGFAVDLREQAPQLVGSVVGRDNDVHPGSS